MCWTEDVTFFFKYVLKRLSFNLLILKICFTHLLHNSTTISFKSNQLNIAYSTKFLWIRHLLYYIFSNILAGKKYSIRESKLTSLRPPLSSFFNFLLPRVKTESIKVSAWPPHPLAETVVSVIVAHYQNRLWFDWCRSSSSLAWLALHHDILHRHHVRRHYCWESCWRSCHNFRSTYPRHVKGGWHLHDILTHCPVLHHPPTPLFRLPFPLYQLILN